MCDDDWKRSWLRRVTWASLSSTCFYYSASLLCLFNVCVRVLDDGRQGVYVREWRDSTAGWPLNSNHRQRREKRERDQTDRQFCFSFWITTLFYFISYQFDILFFYFFLKGGVESGCGGAIAKNANVRDRMGSGGCAKTEEPIFFSSFSASRRMGLFCFYDFFLRFFVKSPRETYKNKTASFRLLPSKFLSSTLSSIPFRPCVAALPKWPYGALCWFSLVDKSPKF